MTYLGLCVHAPLSLILKGRTAARMSPSTNTALIGITVLAVLSGLWLYGAASPHGLRLKGGPRVSAAGAFIRREEADEQSFPIMPIARPK